jgi:hypothetical protein
VPVKLLISVQPSQPDGQVSLTWLYCLQSWKPQDMQLSTASVVCGHVAPCVQAAYFLFSNFCNFVCFFLYSCKIYSAAEGPNICQLCYFHVLWLKSACSVWSPQKLIWLVNIPLRQTFYNKVPLWTEKLLTVSWAEISEKNQDREGGIQCFMCVQVR